METSPFLKCLRCGHEWTRRNFKRDPKVCPSCKSPYWNKERKSAYHSSPEE
jgi:DNA-directed RNA polymerase subunit RPC12/RpoP